MTGWPAAELCTGERVVVFLFVSRVLLSAPVSLLYEALALAVLTCAGLLTEIAADRSLVRPRFKTRQYWTVSASTIGVLVFLCLTLHQPPKSASSFALGHSWIAKLILLHSVLCLVARYFSPPKMSDSGWVVIEDIFWLVCCGLTTIVLLKYILHKFSSCASIGEALLVCSCLILYCGDALACTLVKGVMIGLLLLPLFYKTVIQGMHCLTILKKPETLNAAGWAYRMIETLIFCGSLVVLLIILVPAWLHFLQDFHMHPVLWIFKFVSTDPLRCLGLCIYWISLICFSVFRFYNISKHSGCSNVFPCSSHSDFLDLAFGTALGGFLVLEMIRIWNIWPLGHIMHQFMNAFTDHHDSEILIISHFSLLLGCALPKWISHGFKDRPLAPFAGILSLGIGDTMASVVGHKYGILRWSKIGKKTIEGTTAGITSVLVACSMLLPLVASTGYILS